MTVYSVFVNILHIRIWAHNFKNIEVRSMKCSPLKSVLHFDQDCKKNF